MSITKTYGTYPSANGRSTVHYTVWKPEGNPSAMVQISHGMCEYIDRYDETARYLCEQGYIVFGNDHIGHGRSAENSDDLGYFAESDGDLFVMRDLYTLNQLMKKTYRSLPTILWGHSFGSFVARAYLMAHGDSIDGLILSGTSGGGQPLGLAKFLCKQIAKCKGGRYRSKFIHNIAFGSYNKRFANGKNSTGYEWVTSGSEALVSYVRDPYCMFQFTVQGFYDLFTVLSFVNSEEWYEKVPKGLPIYLTGGSEDPVCNYGKDLQLIAENLLEYDSSDIEYKIYKDEHHEPHTGVCKAEAMADIATFVEKVTDGVQEARRASYWMPAR